MNYELINQPINGLRNYHAWWRIPLLITLCGSTTILVFLCWSSLYDKTSYPTTDIGFSVPHLWYQRAHAYADSVQLLHDFRLTKNQTVRLQQSSGKYALDVSKQQAPQRLVCYYSTAYPSAANGLQLRLVDVDAKLCTHIIIGPADVQNMSIVLSASLERELQEELPTLRQQNAALKALLWIGGGDVGSGFPQMVENHSNRKVFLQSMKALLKAHKLDGIDLDWEFPSAYKKERQHFSQLLYEIKQEYRRERHDYLLSVAVAAPEGIAFFAYDVLELNKYADFVNVMSYDYHFYTRSTPFTGLNAPLYARANEHSILGTLNINYSVNWWLTNGLDANKLIVGLPTYGHSFTLVNPFNTRIGAPAKDIGHCGALGFATYSQICWFKTHNFMVADYYDEASCSPYLSANSEWISYENEKSLACKAQYIKTHKLGGAMIFSLNTDDFGQLCGAAANINNNKLTNATFPLTYKVKQILFS